MADTPQPKGLTRIVAASLVGTTIEWYDYFLYGSAAALVFGKVFFPESDPLTGTLLAFLTYAIGFAARPLGALVFGHFGDRIGRKQLLVVSLLMMGVSSALIGCVPGYTTIGIAAPILLTTLRVVQGFALGGEWGGAVLLVSEHGDARRRGFWASWPQGGAPAGNLIAVGVLSLMTSVQSDAAFVSWGWRIPFLCSLLLIAVGIAMRMRVSESPVFEALEQRKNVRRVPALTVFHKAPLRLVLSLALTAPIAFNSYMYTTYGLTFSVSKGVSSRDTLIGVILATFLAIFLVPLTGFLSDRFGRKPVFLIQVALTGVIAFPYFALLNTGNPELLFLGAVVLVAPTNFALTGAQAGYLPELFASAYRYSGVAMSRELTTAGLTSFTPIVGLGLVSVMHGQPWLLAGACLFVSLLSFTAVCFLPETRGIIMTPDAADTSEASTVPASEADDTTPAVA